jgi:hypothetical protein
LSFVIYGEIEVDKFNNHVLKQGWGAGKRGICPPTRQISKIKIEKK